MHFTQAVTTCLTRYVTFSGRASRSEFWWFFLFQLIVSLLVSAVSQSLSGVIALLLLLPSLAVGARRLHDIGRTGWWQLLTFTGIGFLLLLFWWVQPSGDSERFPV